MQKVIWHPKVGGNVAGYYERCMNDYYRCPQEAIQYLWAELISDVLLHTSTNEILQFIKFNYVVMWTFFILFLYLLLHEIWTCSYVRRILNEESSLIFLQELENKLRVLRYDIDKGHHDFLVNLNARINNATNEITYMRRSLMKILEIDEKSEPFYSLDTVTNGIDNICKQDYNSDGNVQMTKLINCRLNRKSVSLSTDEHVQRIRECFSCLRDLMHRKNHPMLWIRLIAKRIGAAIKNTFYRGRRTKDAAEMGCIIQELRDSAFRAISLINDKHSGIMNESYRTIRNHIDIMQGRIRNISDKLDIILCTLENWHELLTNRFVIEKRYKDIVFCRPVTVSITKLRDRLRREIEAISTLKEIASVKEATESYSTTKTPHRIIRNNYNKVIVTMFSEQDMDVFDELCRKESQNMNLYKFICVRNIVRKTRSLSTHALQCKSDEEVPTESPKRSSKNMYRRFYEFEMQATKLKGEGEQKKIVLRNILANLEYLREKNIVFSFGTSAEEDISKYSSPSSLSDIIN